jgi:hypothetical protein
MPVIASVTGCSTCKAGVHLDEEELAVLVEELDGADAQVADGLDGIDHHLADPGAGFGVDGGRGGLLPAPSGGGAAASSRVRPRWQTLPKLSAITCSSMCRGVWR